MSAPRFNFVDLASDGNLTLSSPTAALDTFTDLNGHDMLLSNNTNFYLWGKSPAGGGAIVYAIWDTATVNGLTQKAVRFVPTITQTVPLSIELNCTCKSKMELAVGMIDYSSNAYTEVGRADIDGFTKAKFSTSVALQKYDTFYVVVWQTALGDSIRVLDYFIDGAAKWRNVITFG